MFQTISFFLLYCPNHFQFLCDFYFFSPFFPLDFWSSSLFVMLFISKYLILGPCVSMTYFWLLLCQKLLLPYKCWLDWQSSLFLTLHPWFSTQSLPVYNAKTTKVWELFHQKQHQWWEAPHSGVELTLGPANVIFFSSNNIKEN